MTIQQLQIRYQQALENRRTAREAHVLSGELLDIAERAHDETKRALWDALGEEMPDANCP